MPAVTGVRWRAHTDRRRGVVWDADHGHNAGMLRAIGRFSLPMIVEGATLLLSTMAPVPPTIRGARRCVVAACASGTRCNTATCRYRIGLRGIALFDAPREPNAVSRTRGRDHPHATAKQRRLQIAST
jgi:hypothetical protein